MNITEELLRKVVAESIKRTKELREAFRMEKDFKKGMPVTWNTLEKVTKKTASGREKVDYQRVENKGYIMDLVGAPLGSVEPGLAVVQDMEGNTQEIALTELTPVKA